MIYLKQLIAFKTYCYVIISIALLDRVVKSVRNRATYLDLTSILSMGLAKAKVGFKIIILDHKVKSYDPINSTSLRLSI